MNYLLYEESGDSEMDNFDPGGNKAAVDVEDAESCCSGSFYQLEEAQTDGDYHPSCRRINNGIKSTSSDTYCDNDGTDSGQAVNIDHSATKNKLKNSVSESLGCSSVVNMDEITDDRLFWEACLAQGNP